MFLIYFISYGCNDSALVFLGGAEASASPSFALPMFITIKKIIILHLHLRPCFTVFGDLLEESCLLFLSGGLSTQIKYLSISTDT